MFHFDSGDKRFLGRRVENRMCSLEMIFRNQDIIAAIIRNILQHWAAKDHSLTGGLRKPKELIKLENH
jgi:hypothetical protein